MSLGNERQVFSAEGGVVITPSDTAEFPATRALRCGTGGASLKVRMANGHDLTIPDVLDGEWLPIAVTMVYSTGTVGVTDILGFS